MLFHTHFFLIVFLPIVFTVYFYLNKRRFIPAGNLWLCASSLFFYSWMGSQYLPLLVFSITANFLISRAFLLSSQTPQNLKKIYLFLGIGLNLGLLIFYKYADFFIVNLNDFTGTDIPFFEVALPLAISFFTIQQIAFLVDSYEGFVEEKNFLRYFLFVSFFPKLLAGPIVSYADIAPQFDRLKNKILNHKNISMGLFIFSVGLFKKVMIADQLALWGSTLHSDIHSLSFLDAWASVYLYTFQLYFDFSAYSDMALGVALIFNIKLPLNFDSPLKAKNIVDFWRRWHISLGNFMKSYVLAVMLRCRRKVSYSYSLWAMFVSMFLIGIWHDASWNFVFFGIVHGLVIVIHSLWKKTKIHLHWLLSWFLTFHFICLSLIFASTNSIESSMLIISKIFYFDGSQIIMPDTLLRLFDASEVCYAEYGYVLCVLLFNLKMITIICAIIAIFFGPNSYALMQKIKPNNAYLILNVVVLLLPIIFLSQVKEFIYFKF